MEQKKFSDGIYSSNNSPLSSIEEEEKTQGKRSSSSSVVTIQVMPEILLEQKNLKAVKH